MQFVKVVRSRDSRLAGVNHYAIAAGHGAVLDPRVSCEWQTEAFERFEVGERRRTLRVLKRA